MQDDKNAIFQMRFPQKLWYLLNLRPDAILWGGTGRTILLNYCVLQSYLKCDHSVFKTTNISSFVRQLNLYGFRKVTSHLQDPLCNSSNPYMHEYVHDYFQFGRPELLNKITRKALTMKRNFKPKMSFQNTINNVEQLLCLTPLQKARFALQIALKKAAQELHLQDSSKQLSSMQFECGGGYSGHSLLDSQDDMCEDEESFEFDWMSSNNDKTETNTPPEPEVSTEKNQKGIEKTITKVKEEIQNVEESETLRDSNRDSLMSFPDDSCQQNSDSFSTPFLSMPDLDPVPTDSKSGEELLAEFNIHNEIDQGIDRKLRDDEHGSLNCVLPSISHDQNDETMVENNVNMDHYNGEWDQMFNDMIDRSSSQECGSELKDLYSQISKTIDLLNS